MLQSSFQALLLVSAILGAALGQDECGNCLRLDTGAIVGIVICDVIITVLIALLAYYVSTKIQRSKLEERSKQNDGQEPTYEELQGQRLDVYTDLSHRRN
ncbi:TYRO protein tyrosine kinase-binding protein [Discoglossus pictus]